MTVLCVGLNGEWESESYDRDDIEMPGNINDLIRAVLEAQPNSIIVNQSGMPVAMPWSDQARTIVQAFYGGNDCGTGIADVLCGKVNPSAKLPFTWPREIENYPAHAGFGHPKDTFYSEGLGVGYRYFDRTGSPTSLFPFGHGLSYSKFQYRYVRRPSRADDQSPQYKVDQALRAPGELHSDEWWSTLWPRGCTSLCAPSLTPSHSARNRTCSFRQNREFATWRTNSLDCDAGRECLRSLRSLMKQDQGFLLLLH